jgi:hypothetical protein
MDSGRRVEQRAGLGLLGYIFVGMTAAVMVMVMAVAVVLVDVTGRAPIEAAPADISAARR